MRCPTSLHEHRVYGPENFWSPVQKDFCNRIPQSADSPPAFGTLRAASVMRRDCTRVVAIMPSSSTLALVCCELTASIRWCVFEARAAVAVDCKAIKECPGFFVLSGKVPGHCECSGWGFGGLRPFPPHLTITTFGRLRGSVAVTQMQRGYE
jgi:hypothetical protein